MKKLLMIAIIGMATICHASPNYLVIAMRKDASSDDKQLVRAKMKQFFNDVTEINVADLPVWRQKNDHTKEWWVVCFAIDVGTVKKIGLTKAQFDDWKNTPGRLDNPARLQMLACGMNPSADIQEAGLEPIPTEEP